jgi:nitroimidazol reductase NimA-like FMN-containing flavoprotein (pyridoxamine 5'-phosphate oxidase superfamily)
MSANLLEIPYHDCLELLKFGNLGRIAVVVDGFPVVVPVNYRLVESTGRTWIAFRTRVGNVLDRDRAPAAFEVRPRRPGRARGLVRARAGDPPARRS